MFGAGRIEADAVALLFLCRILWFTSEFGCVSEVPCISARGEINCGTGCDDVAGGVWDASRSVPLLADLVLVDLLGIVYILLFWGLLAVLDQKCCDNTLASSYLVFSC